MLTERHFKVVWDFKPVWVHFGSHVNVPKDEEIGGCSRSSHSFTCFIYDWPCDCSDGVGQEGGQLQRYDSNSNIYVSGPIFVKLSNDFNPSCFSPTFLMKKVFQWNTWNLKGPSIKLVQLARCFVFQVLATFILKSFCLFFSLAKDT